MSIPGGRLHHLNDRLPAAVKETGAKTVVLHMGTNDVVSDGSEVVAKRIFEAARRAKSLAGVTSVYVCSIIPRVDRSSFIYSRADSVNNCLKDWSVNGEYQFVDMREELERCRFNGHGRDDVHYNRAGAMAAVNTLSKSLRADVLGSSNHVQL